MTRPSILVVDDEPHSRFGICEILNEEGYQTISAENGKEALVRLKTDPIDVIITDEKMPGFTGMDLLSQVKKMDSPVPVILITAYGSVSMAVEALKQGAFYFFEKPIFSNLDQFLAIIRQALKTQEMEKELNFLRREVSEKYAFPNIVGKHPKIVEVFEIIERVGKTDKTVLIQGESGTGKDLIAKTIHYNSLRKEKPFITVNCGALTETLLTTELFGQTKGAFTGAVRDTIGRFQMADGGTLLLDDIAEVPYHLQKTLLRIVEEKEFERVGDSRSIKVDVRIFATTNRNLREEVSKGNFREDLYYRMSVVPLTIPPLRERLSDIPLLVGYFLKKFHEGGPPIRIEPEVIEHLCRYRWPGNVRELANIIQQMMVLCDGSRITIDDLPSHLASEESISDEGTEGEIQLMRIVADIERKWIFGKLHETGWNKERTANLLGITRKMLTNRIAKYKIKRPKKGSAGD